VSDVYIKSGWGFNVGQDFTRAQQDIPLEDAKKLGKDYGGRANHWTGYIKGDPNSKLGFMRNSRIKVVVDPRGIGGAEAQDASTGIRIVHNKLLGGWYVVRGPAQTPLNGRFDSKEEAEAWLRRKQGADAVMPNVTRALDARRRAGDADRPYGQRVKILGGMSEFVGKTGTIQGKEGNTYRVKLDTPVEVSGVGKVYSDLWESPYLKTI